MPGSQLAKKIKPSRLLPIYMLGWSITCLGTGFMQTVPQFYASRLLIGFFEAGMAPVFAMTLTTFYIPKEQGHRFYYLYLFFGLAGAFGGLFAYGLLQLNGRAGLADWRYENVPFLLMSVLANCLTSDIDGSLLSGGSLASASQSVSGLSCPTTPQTTNFSTKTTKRSRSCE
jgi:MFS family permease